MIHPLLKYSAIVALGLALTWPVAPACADNDTANAVSANSRVDALQAEVTALRAEVQDLRANGDDAWLNESRAEEIRALTRDVLADADARAGLADDGLTAGHDGTFYLQSNDGNFRMNVGGLLQYRWIGNFRDDESGRASVSPDDDTETGFEFRRVELGFSGHIFDPKFGYVLVLATEDGAAGVEEIIAQDIVLSYAASDKLTFTGGRYFAPLLREELIGGGGSLAVALSYMNNVLSIGRGEGISAKYQDDKFRAHAFFSDGAGSGGGGGVNNPFADAVDWALTARGDIKFAGEWGQWGDFSAMSEDPLAAFVGGAVHVQSGETGDDLAVNDVDLFAWTIDGSIECNRFNFYAAAAGNHTDTDAAADIDNYGFLAQAGYMAVADTFELFARYEFLSFDEDLGYAEDDVSLVTVGANYHVNERVKLGFDVVYALDPIPTDSLNAGLLADGVEDGQIVVRAQAQLKF